MNIDEFAEITSRVIARDGFEGYLPTLCIPGRKHITVLEGVPVDKQPSIREIALAWAQEKTEPTEEYFLAYKEDIKTFRIIHHCEDSVDEKSFSVKTAETANKAARPDR